MIKRFSISGMNQKPGGFGVGLFENDSSVYVSIVGYNENGSTKLYLLNQKLIKDQKINVEIQSRYLSVFINQLLIPYQTRPETETAGANDGMMGGFSAQNKNKEKYRFFSSTSLGRNRMNQPP